VSLLGTFSLPRVRRDRLDRPQDAALRRDRLCPCPMPPMHPHQLSFQPSINPVFQRYLLQLPQLPCPLLPRVSSCPILSMDSPWSPSNGINIWQWYIIGSTDHPVVWHPLTSPSFPNPYFWGRDFKKSCLRVLLILACPALGSRIRFGHIIFSYSCTYTSCSFDGMAGGGHADHGYA